MTGTFTRDQRGGIVYRNHTQWQSDTSGINVIITTMETNHNHFIQPYTHKQLAEYYNVSWTTFQKWLKPYRRLLGKKNGHFFDARQVNTIFIRFGIPKGLTEQAKDNRGSEGRLRRDAEALRGTQRNSYLSSNIH